jgi:hypothetical protein
MTQSAKELFDSLHPIRQRILWLLSRQNKSRNETDYEVLFSVETQKSITTHYEYLLNTNIICSKMSRSMSTQSRINNLNLLNYIRTIPVEQLYDRKEILGNLKTKLQDVIQSHFAALKDIGLLSVSTEQLSLILTTVDNVIDETTEALKN